MSLFRRAAERRGQPADLLVVGIGNPGRSYAGTRHNVGAEVVQVLAGRRGATLKPSRREEASVAEVRLGDARVVLAVPSTYVNETGRCVAKLVPRHGVDDPERLVIVHDELDLEVGRLKVKAGGGLAGHNGLRSVRQHLGTDRFARVRLGVGKPPDPRSGADHVLRPPSKADRAELDVVVQEAADAVETIATEGIDAAMTRYNAR